MTLGNAETFDVDVGKFGAPHGIRGLIRLFSYTEDPQSIFTYPLYCKKMSSEIKIACENVVNNAFIVRVEGIMTREAVGLLTGNVLYTLRSALPKAEENSWYVTDIIGATLYDSDGQAVGEVFAVHNFGAGDVIEAVTVNGEKKMYPFSMDFVDNVDVSGRRVVLKEFFVQEDVS
ncbi:MAG: ribosome maturation factor RimM [Rickettsiales bacterium]